MYQWKHGEYVKVKKDACVTRLLRSEGIFTDPRSHISLPLLDGEAHLFLFGEDKGKQRTKVFQFHKRICSVCGHLLHDDGDWHHVEKRHCDCLRCSEIRCSAFTGRPCHLHGKSGFRRKAREMQATKQDAS